MADHPDSIFNKWLKPVPWRGWDRLVLVGTALLGVLNLVVLAIVFLGG